jgi:hypothetical protein
MERQSSVSTVRFVLANADLSDGLETLEHAGCLARTTAKGTALDVETLQTTVVTVDEKPLQVGNRQR